jgi:GGDEF domain-containing protein
MISIRRFLDRRPDETPDALLRTTQVLLEGIERHAVRPDAADYDRFCKEMRLLQEDLKEGAAVSEILVLAGQALKAMEGYNSHATMRMRAQCEDLQNMVAMLTKTMAAITSESQSSISRLQEIEATLQTASALEDFHVAKVRMSECLDVLNKEIVHRRSESAKQVSQMHSAVQGLRSPRLSHSPEELARKDPLTGLIERAGAEAALAAAVKESQPAFAAVFVADRLDMINARFGRPVGDDVLLFFSQHIAHALKEADRRYRWTGPAILAILHRTTSLASVREDINGMFARRLTMNVTSENRSVMLALPAKWMVFAAQEIRPLPRLIKSIDAFVHGEPAGAA